MLNGLFRGVSKLTGSFSYQAPGWMLGLQKWRQGSPLVFSVASCCLFFSALLISWWAYLQLNRPAQPLVHASIELEQLQTDAPLFIQFSQPTFLSSDELVRQRPTSKIAIAAIDLLNNSLNEFVTMSPSLSGEWRWENNELIVFTPNESWPAGQTFELTLSPLLFNPEIKLSKDELNFSTEDLTLTIDEFRFYQNPSDSNEKSLIATLSSNYEIDQTALAEALSLSMQAGLREETNNKDELPFDIRKNIDSNTYYLTAQIAQLPDRENYATLSLEHPMSALVGGKDFSDKLEQQTIVPDIYSFLDIVDVSTKIIEDPNADPMQTILIEFTDAIDRAELTKRLTLYALPKKNSQGRLYQWKSPAQVPDSLRSKENIVPFRLLNEHLAATTNHLISVDLEHVSHLLLHIEHGLNSTNAYVRSTEFDAIVELPSYPQQVFFAHKGMTLNNSFSPQLGIGSRGVDALSIELGQVPMNQVIHLVTQTRGDITNLDFQNWSFNERNLAHFNQRILPLSKRPSNQLNRAILNIEDDLEGSPTGLFIVKAKAYDKDLKRTIYGVEAQKLLLLTDLGLLVKHEKNQQLKVFVQSIATGEPAVNTEVSILMPNGKSLISGFTDKQGMVQFKVPRNLQAGEYPSAILARNKQDFSFIPYDNYSAQIDYSRMNSGGVSTHWGGVEEASAYLFNDRGFYRPGESVKLAAVVKNKKLVNTSKLNLKWLIRNPNYEIVHEQPVLVDRINQGFIEAEFVTQTNDLTGTYTAFLHLLNANEGSSSSALGRQIGASQFILREFEADTLSLSTEIVNLRENISSDFAWTSNPNIIAKAQLTNLVGIPAVGNRVLSVATVRDAPFVSDEFTNFNFYIPRSEDISEQEYELDEQNTNKDGVVDFVFDFYKHSEKEASLAKKKINSGMYRIVLTVKAFELDSGKFVDTTTSLLFSPLESLIAYQADFNPDFLIQGQPAALSLLNYNKLRRLQARNDLRLSVIKKEIISALIKQDDGSFKYQEDVKRIPLTQSAYSFSEQIQTLKLDTSKVGEYQIQIHDDQGLLVFELDYAVHGEGNERLSARDANQLSLSLNKQDIKAGDTLELSIQAPYTGSGLITIETDQVEHFQWFTSNTLSSIHSITVPKHLEGNAYVNVAFIRDPSSDAIAATPFSYGLLNFTIDRSKRILETSLEVSPIVNPDKPSQVVVNLDRSARLLMFAVDEGILQAANYQRPEPLDFFLRKKALGVRTHQILDKLLPDINLTAYTKAPGGAVMAEMRMRAADAGRASKSINPFARKVISPAVYWSSIKDGQKGKNYFEVDLPDDFNGQISYFAIAVTDDAIGTARNKSLVQSPFLVAGNLPTHISPNDEIETSLKIRALERLNTNSSPVNIKISASPHITILSDKNISTSSLAPSDLSSETTIDLRFKANNKFGPAHVDIEVSGVSESGKVVNTKRRFTLSNRPLSQAIKNIQFGTLEKQVSIDLPYELAPEYAEQFISLARSPSALIRNMYDAIKGDSQALQAGNAHKLILLKVLVLLPSLDNEQLRLYQELMGAITNSEVSNDITTSLGIFELLLNARMKQREVDNRIYQRSLDFTLNVANASIQTSSTNRAYAIYLITRHGVVSTNYLLNQEQANKQQVIDASDKNIIRAYQAATYQLLQQTELAQNRLADIDWKSLKTPENLGASLKLLNILNRHFATTMSDAIKQSLEHLYPYVNQGVSPTYLLELMGIYSSISGPSQAPLNIDIQAESSDGKRTSLQGENKSIKDGERLFVPTGTSTVHLETDSQGYYLFEQSGYQKSLRLVQNKVEIAKTLLDPRGNALEKSAAGEYELELGEDILVTVNARAKGTLQLDNVMLIDLLPAGFTMVPNSFRLSSELTKWPSYKDEKREDRIILNTRLGPSGIEFSYRIKPTVRGIVSLPSASLQSIERYDVFAQSASESTIKVNKQGNL